MFTSWKDREKQLVLKNRGKETQDSPLSEGIAQPIRAWCKLSSQGAFPALDGTDL